MLPCMCVTIRNSMHGVLLLPSLKKQREFIQGPINFENNKENVENIFGYHDIGFQEQKRATLRNYFIQFNILPIRTYTYINYLQ